MPSVDSKELVDELIANDGYYSTDPRAHQISQYTNDWGGTTYHLAYSKDDVIGLYTSPFCHDIKVLWKAGYPSPAKERQ